MPSKTAKTPPPPEVPSSVSRLASGMTALTPMLLSAAKPNGASPTPLVVRIGDHFLGAQMAVRRAGDAPHAADWSDIFPPATDKAGAA